jgi:hypothetical protein
MLKRTTFSFVAALCALTLSSSIPAQADVLQGKVETDTHLRNKQPALNRTKDVGGGDPFSGKDDTGPAMDAIDPGDAIKQLNQQPTFNLNTQTTGPDRYQMPLPTQQVQQPPPPKINPNDPDSGNPELQLAWDMWHKRVAEAIYVRYNFFARAAFQRSQPLLCQVSYVVTRDGHIQALDMKQKSNNVLYNVLVFQAIKSLDGDVNLLQFPPGSRRQFVPKYGTFAQNYGANGFKYTTGDQETLRQ